MPLPRGESLATAEHGRISSVVAPPLSLAPDDLLDRAIAVPLRCLFTHPLKC
jgi:hypothetical protein